MTQSQRVLEAFLRAPGQCLTTVQLHNLPYITNVRARVSNLRQLGHFIEAVKIEGKRQSMFKYHGLLEPLQYVPDVKATRWHPLPNNFEVLY